MTFNYNQFESLLPHYLVNTEKTRLKDALKQFAPEHKGSQIDYSSFYNEKNYNYFLQSDLVKDIRIAVWNNETSSYDTKYIDAIIISNTCDISNDNVRSINPKQCLMAPLINFKEYLQDLRNEGYSEQKIKSFAQDVISQQITNIFYLPSNPKDQIEYIAVFDRLFWLPTQELNSYNPQIGEDKIISLSNFGFYLFILKLSFHLCRLPEENDRGGYNLQNTNTITKELKSKKLFGRIWEYLLKK